MKSVLLLALAVALVAATPQVASFNYAFADWFTSNFDYLVLSIILPIYAFIGFFEALFGESAWFNTNAYDAISGTWAMPAFDSQSYDMEF
jgi:hypothetical protein